MGTRLKGHMLECHGILAPDMATGTFAVTMMVGTFAEIFADMVGGTMVVLAAAKEGRVYGGCRLDEDAVKLLCQSARGTYVFRGLTAADWLKVTWARSEAPGALGTWRQR